MKRVPCNGCTACCRRPVEIRPSLGDDLKQFMTVTNKFGTFLRCNPDGWCHYRMEKGCSIWPHTPAICRAFDCREYVKNGLMNSDLFSDTEVTRAGQARL